MLKRLVITMMLFLVPASAFAEDAAPLDESAPPTASGTPSPATSAPDTTTSTDNLGPGTIAPGTGGSTADSTALQPAGKAPLQSSANDSNGLTAPNASTLQTPLTGDAALRVLAENADGSTHQPGDETVSSAPGWIAFAIVLALILAAGATVVMRDRRRFATTEPR